MSQAVMAAFRAGYDTVEIARLFNSTEPVVVEELRRARHEERHGIAPAHRPIGPSLGEREGSQSEPSETCAASSTNRRSS
jgi:hypothetical protein